MKLFAYLDYPINWEIAIINKWVWFSQLDRNFRMIGYMLALLIQMVILMWIIQRYLPRGGQDNAFSS